MARRTPTGAPEQVRIPHQALLEFVAVVTRVHRGTQPLLSDAHARREAEELLTQFTVLCANAVVFRTALRRAAAYQLSCFDAHLWACAEHYGLDEIVSEDFDDGRFYGSVRARLDQGDPVSLTRLLLADFLETRIQRDRRRGPAMPEEFERRRSLLMATTFTRYLEDNLAVLVFSILSTLLSSAHRFTERIAKV